MGDPNMTLLSSVLAEVVAALSDDAASESAWSTAREALPHYEVDREEDPELIAAIEEGDADGLRSILAGWADGKRLMLVRDRGVLKRALKAFRKRLKITLLDAECSVDGGPMSAGRKSNIVGVVPPERYPREVWDELVHQKRLVYGGQGTYELPPGG